MSKNQDKIENRIWAIANKLRNKIEPDEFKSYCLGFVFYKFLSEKQNLYADEILKNDKRKFLDLKLNNKEDKKLIKIIEEESISNLGYHLNIEDLFFNVCKKISNGDFILDTLSKIFRKIENSTKGTESEESFEGLFDDIDLTSRKLGKSEEDKNKLISSILIELDKIEFSLVDYNQDILGDVYEYLISQFASNAGKKAGEFYTPQQVSKILSSITLGSVNTVKEVYDPTCGSGSLLLGLLRENKKIKCCYGQESTGTTYNLSKMNMILNGLHYRRFNIKHDDTLEKPQHMDKKFDIIVSNPPFSSKWKPNASLINDIRFKPYGVLAPDSKADFAFVAHMLHHLKKDGIMCVILSRGSLYRESVETNLKKAFIEKYNYLDGIIGLPKNIFYISKAPTCILIFKKNRKANEKIILIEAEKLYKKAPKRNIITDEYISRITDIYLGRKEIRKLSKNVDKKEFFENNFNLNISKYVDGTVELPNHDIKKIILNFKKNNELYNQNEKELFKICEKLKVPFPDTNNVNLLLNYKESFRNDLFNKKINLGENIKWENFNLSDILKETFQKTINKNEEIYSVSVHKGLVNQIEHLGRSFAAENTQNYNLVKPGDIVYTRSPTGEFPFGVIKQSKINKSVLVSPLYGVYKPSTIELGNIIDFYFELKENAYNYLHSIVNIGPKNTLSISSDVFLSKKITVPEDKEIIKLISNFINLLNNKINLIYAKN
jgi:type I restriction enzyme M protein